MIKTFNHTKNPQIQLSVLRLTRTIYAFILLFLVQIIIFDSWNLISHEVVTKRWTAAGLLAIANTIVWFLARGKKKYSYYRNILIWFVLFEILFCSFIIYWDRGMASTYALLYVLPLLSIGILRSRLAILATATFCAVAYSTSVVSYFNEYYGEGYDVQLWGQIFFFSGTYFVLAWMIMNLLGIRKDSK